MLAASGASSLDPRKFSPQGLGTAGLSLRNAADMMLDEDWESAMGELEVRRWKGTQVQLEITVETFSSILGAACFKSLN